MFWPPGEAAQPDYEMLRAHLLQAGVLPGGLAAARFTRRGLAGLIAWPAAEPGLPRPSSGAARPPWTPHADPREQALTATCQFLLDAADVLAAAGFAGDGGILMKAAIYARVSTERQAERGTIGSQVETLRAHLAGAGTSRGSTATTGAPEPGWTGPGWTPCATPPRAGCSRRSGACPRTGSPGPTPTRCSSWTSWPVSA